MVSNSSAARNRTSEFRSLSERLKKDSKSGGFKARATDDTTSPSTSGGGGGGAFFASQSAFNRKASAIGVAIHDASTKIARLAKLAKGSSMFNDPAMEIEELTALIKNDITALNTAVSDLQFLQNTEMELRNYSNDRVVHATTICDDLKNKLVGITKQFKDMLTSRTENLEAYENRKQIFSSNASRQNPLMQQAKAVTEPPPWSNGSNTTNGLPSSEIPSNGIQNGSQSSVNS